MSTGQKLVPPAGEVEVLGYFYKGDHMGDQFNKHCLHHYYRRPGAAEHEYIQPVALVDRAHVTKLALENAKLQRDIRDHESANRAFCDITGLPGLAAGICEIDRLRSALTKARDLVRKARRSIDPSCAGKDLRTELDEYLAHQSAPAAKAES